MKQQFLLLVLFFMDLDPDFPDRIRNFGGRIIDNLQIDNLQIDNRQIDNLTNFRQIDNPQIDNLTFSKIDSAIPLPWHHGVLLSLSRG